MPSIAGRNATIVKNSDIFELQDNITKEVVSALQVELTEGDQALLALRGTENNKGLAINL
jgi:hypothetical protein